MKRLVSLTILLACVACGQSESNQSSGAPSHQKMDDAAKTTGDAAKTAPAMKTKTVTLSIDGMT